MNIINELEETLVTNDLMSLQNTLYNKMYHGLDIYDDLVEVNKFFESKNHKKGLTIGYLGFINYYIDKSDQLNSNLYLEKIEDIFTKIDNIEHDEIYLSYYNTKILYYSLIKDYKNAYELSKIAITLASEFPENIAVLYTAAFTTNLSSVFAELGMYKYAIKYLKTNLISFPYLKVEHRSTILFNLICSYVNDNNTIESKKTLIEYEKLAPLKEKLDINIIKADILIRDNDITEADLAIKDILNQYVKNGKIISDLEISGYILLAKYYSNKNDSIAVNFAKEAYCKCRDFNNLVLEDYQIIYNALKMEKDKLQYDVLEHIVFIQTKAIQLSEQIIYDSQENDPKTLYEKSSKVSNEIIDLIYNFPWSMDFLELSKIIHERLPLIFNSDAVYLFRTINNNDKFTLEYYKNHIIKTIEVPQKDLIEFQKISHSASKLYHRFEDPELFDTYEVSPDSKTILVKSLISNDKIIGFFALSFKNRIDVSEQDYIYYPLILEFLSNQIKNINLYDKTRREADYDHLTNCMTRTGLEKYYKNIKSNINTHVILLDIDNFKTYNDTYSHLFGDKMLVDFGTKLLELFGNNIFRIGGEEFLIFSNNKVKESYNKLLELNDNLFIMSEDKKVDYYFSGGIKKIGKLTLEEVYYQADILMLQAKKNGKRKIFISRDEKSITK